MVTSTEMKNSLQNLKVNKPQELTAMYRTASETDLLLPDNPQQQNRFPFPVLFILGNEFCERYSFYGMRTILVLYLTYYINWDDDTSTAAYHAFNVLCYLFPLFGAILADGWWGKYKTILWLSIVYAIGMVLNALGAVNSLGNLTTHAALSSIGLIVIAVGTGGIKPCVAAFGGDQFDADQEKYRLKFFSIFYFAINAGSLISTLVSPIIREKVKCFGADCYALAFGIPAVLMFVALLLFVFGTKWYRRYAPTGDIITKVMKTIWDAIKKRWNTPKYDRTKEHWLDYAETTGNKTLIRDIKYVLNVLVLFVPLPLFWTLFDQQGSRWTLQAVRMNGYVGSVRILPDQMQSCNPILILVLIPISETIIYPGLEKLKIPFRPLQRMAAGMLLAGLSFVVAALVHMKIDVHLTPIPTTSWESSLRVINSAECNIVVNSTIYPDWHKKATNRTFFDGGLHLKPGHISETASTFVEYGKYKLQVACENSTFPDEITVDLKSLSACDLYVSQYNATSLKYLFINHTTKKSDDGNAIFGVVNTLNEGLRVDASGAAFEQINIPVTANNKTELKEITRNVLLLQFNIQNVSIRKNYTADTGGIYTVVVRSNGQILNASNIIIDNYTDVNPNDVNIFWMIPQFFLITLGEILLSITGLSFAYSQAPPSMKSLLQAFWLLTVSIGNIIVLIVAEARLIDSQTNEYFLFAGLIGIAAILFILLAVRYQYVNESEFNEDLNDANEEKHER